MSYNKVLNLFDLTSSSIGSIIGAGIYATIGIVISYSGNLSWLSFLLTGIFTIFTALDYSELSSMYNSNKGEFIYIQESFNKKLAVVIGYLLLITKILIACVLSLAIGYLFKKMFNFDEIYVSIFFIIFCNYLCYINVIMDCFNKVCSSRKSEFNQKQPPRNSKFYKQ